MAARIASNVGDMARFRLREDAGFDPCIWAYVAPAFAAPYQGDTDCGIELLRIGT